MVKKTLLASVLYLVVVASTIIWVMHIHTVLFHTAYYWLIFAFVAGTAAGVLRAIKRKRLSNVSQTQAPRHTVASFLGHWGTGVGIIILIVSGALLASGSRVGFIFVPEFSVLRITALNLHFLGVFFTLLFGFFFLLDFLVSGDYKELLPRPADIRGVFSRYLLRKKWDERGKYLFTQKLAFLAFALLGVIVLVTGAVKISYFIFPIPLNRTAGAHDLAGELILIMLIVHILFVVAVPSHWRLLRSWFTGKEKDKN